VDVRSFMDQPSQLDQARNLAGGGLLNDKPFIFGDRLRSGLGAEHRRRRFRASTVNWVQIGRVTPPPRVRGGEQESCVEA
jgi:hypothetical protein